jgi:hypothetical protein
MPESSESPSTYNNLKFETIVIVASYWAIKLSITLLPVKAILRLIIYIY